MPEPVVAPVIAAPQVVADPEPVAMPEPAAMPEPVAAKPEPSLPAASVNPPVMIPSGEPVAAPRKGWWRR